MPPSLNDPRYHAFVGMGASTGERLATLRSALRELISIEETQILKTSSVYATSPVGPASGEFFNAAVCLGTAQSPNALMRRLLEIETAHGRQRTVRWGDRSLDLDLLLMREGSSWIDCKSESLELPHPRIRDRDFVLVPLGELGSDIRLQGHTPLQWLAKLPCEQLTIRRRVCDSAALQFLL